jgi:flagellar basal body P-ring formation protein FlgA
MRLLLASILILTAPALASDFQPTDDIRAAALGAIGGGPGVRAEASVDDAIRLPRCGEPLSASLTTASTVEVGCSSAGWRLFVPVRIQRMEEVWVLTRPLGAGQTISADALRAEARDVARIAGGALPASQPVEGQIARRGLMAGSVLQSQDLVAPRAIRRGDSVTLVSRIGSIEVRAAGRSLGDGGISERINVENLATRRVVQGVVRSAGEVEVAR